ncbi:unnamed protein product, partial [Polarella glacialis]
APLGSIRAAPVQPDEPLPLFNKDKKRIAQNEPESGRPRRPAPALFADTAGYQLPAPPEQRPPPPPRPSRPSPGHPSSGLDYADRGSEELEVPVFGWMEKRRLEEELEEQGEQHPHNLEQQHLEEEAFKEQYLEQDLEETSDDQHPEPPSTTPHECAFARILSRLPAMTDSTLPSNRQPKPSTTAGHIMHPSQSCSCSVE